MKLFLHIFNYATDLALKIGDYRRLRNHWYIWNVGSNEIKEVLKKLMESKTVV